MMSNRPHHSMTNSGSDVAPTHVSSGVTPTAPGTSEQLPNEANKRAALAGQWRTPPLPFFPTSSAAAVQPTVTAPAPPPLPDNSEEYAKALQEAYRRGAEAAAAMHARQQQHHHQQPVQQVQTAQPPPQQQQPQPIAPSVSCPNFQMSSQPPPMTTTTAPPQSQAPPLQQQQQPQQPTLQQQQQPPILATRSEDMTPYATAARHPLNAAVAPAPPPPTAPTYATPAYATGGSAQPVPTTTTSSAGTAVVPNPLSNMPPPPKPPPKPTATGSVMAAAAAAAVAVSNPQQRSLSLPDMTSYAVQAEEEKRQKRLARNRASARLRRLRKKNLVDAYENEVGTLEKTLQQLKAHEWGTPNHPSGPRNNYGKSHHSLMEALSMERGQQDISAEQRTQQCQDILTQQLQQLELLREVQLEQELLAAVAAGGATTGGGGGTTTTSGTQETGGDEFEGMVQELRGVLQLSDDQMAKMKEASKGLKDEVAALDTVFSSLSMMKDNEWLLNQGVQDITDQMTSIMHKNQMSKFLLWADANVEAIDQLDHVHALPEAQKQQHILQGPIFTFGVETTPMEDDESKGQ